MYDIVFYKDALEQSLKLGWKGVIEISGKKAKLITPKEEREIKITFFQGNRKNSESKKNVYLENFELLEKKDSMHYPKSGMDQIIAKLMKKNNNTYCFPTQLLIKKDTKVGRRVILNLTLANKYEFPVLLASFAKKKEEQRSPELIRALAESLGIREDLAKKSYMK